MKQTHSCFRLLHFMMISLPLLVSSQTCQRFCGQLPLKYPFGSSSGCGDPRFQNYVNCNQNKLTLTTHTGFYPVTDIDYSNQVIYISDPSMSTCACTQPSKGFGLNWDAPFSFHDDDVFTLLDCSIDSSSPLYNSSVISQCDKKSAAICSYFDSCRASSMLNLPVSACCVYAPVDLGPAFNMDLKNFQCSSYSGFYNFSGQEANPENWKYGIALKYKFNVYNDYPSSCVTCERSNGACGYAGDYNSFICNCPSGVNTTTDCNFETSFNNAPGLLQLPWQQKTGNWLICIMAWILIWVSSSSCRLWF